MASYTITQGDLDNGIYEVIRKKLVASNLLPDVTLYDVETQQGKQEYKDALNAIPHVVNLFSVGGAESRGTLKDSVIIIDRALPKMAKSGVGKDVDFDYDEATGKYKQTVPAGMKYDIVFTITYISKRNSIAEKIELIIMQAFKERAYITSLNEEAEPTGNFWLIRSGQFDTSGKDYIERGATFEARNIDLIGPEQKDDVAPFDIDKFCFEPDVDLAIYNEFINMIGVDSNGDLWYNSDQFIFSLDENGDLFVTEHPEAEMYLDNLGDIYLFTD